MSDKKQKSRGTKTSEPQKTDMSKDESIIPQEILENLEPEQQEKIKKAVASFSSMVIQTGIREQHPFASLIKLFNPDHITNLINNDEKASARIFDEGKDIRKTNFKVFLISLIAFLGLCCLFIFTDNQSGLFDLIKIIIPIAGAGLGGYGYALSRKK